MKLNANRAGCILAFVSAAFTAFMIWGAYLLWLSK